MTDAPSVANCLTIPAPIPFDAPVTTATFPFSFPFFIVVPFIRDLAFQPLACNVTSIYNQRGTGREFRIVGSEIENGCGDFFTGTDSAHRSDRGDLVAHLVPGEAIEHLGGDHTRRNCVDPNVLFGELERDR